MGAPKQITNLSADSAPIINDVIAQFCDPVISTLGPEGRTVIIDDDANGETIPHVTKDGVTVADSINFKDRRMQAIASLIKESARNTGNSVGDGTTTSVLLTKAFLQQALSLRDVLGMSQKDFFDGFDLAYEHVIEFIESISTPITMDSPLLESVVKISTNCDKQIYPIILSGAKAVGVDGLLSAELSNEGSTSIEVKSGSTIESNAYITRGKRWEASEPGIILILVSGPIQKVAELKNILLMCKTSPTVVVAKEFSDEVKKLVEINNLRNVVNVALVESEGFARNSRLELLEDLASIFDVPVYSTDESTAYPLSSFELGAHYSVSKVIVTPTETVLYSSYPELSASAEERLKEITRTYLAAKSEVEPSAGELAHLKRRLSKFAAIAVIKVGAVTKAEAIELKDRVDDAICSISAAINGGIVPGGGSTLYRAALEFGSFTSDNEDQMTGYNVFMKACKTPMITLFHNSGIVYDSSACESKLSNNSNVVYDFKDDVWVDYLVGGIVDPTNVTKAALTNASSVAKTILKSNFIITEWQEDK